MVRAWIVIERLWYATVPGVSRTSATNWYVPAVVGVVPSSEWITPFDSSTTFGGRLPDATVNV